MRQNTNKTNDDTRTVNNLISNDMLRQNTIKPIEDVRLVNNLNSNNVDDKNNEEKRIGQPSQASNAFGSRQRNTNNN